MKENVYLCFDQNIEVTHQSVTVGDLATVWCSDQNLITRIKTLKAYQFQNQKENFHAFSSIDVVQLIEQELSNLEILCLGEPEFVVHFHDPTREHRWLEYGKAALICIITFFGAAFAIMTFNEDVSVRMVFEDIYALAMGRPQEGFSILEATYSIGLTVGILVFYNHFRRKAVRKDPTPIEVQMRLYEQEVNTAIIENEKRKGAGSA